MLDIIIVKLLVSVESPQKHCRKDFIFNTASTF